MIIRTALGDYYTHAVEPTLFSLKPSKITAHSCKRNVVKQNGQQLKKRKTKSVEIGRSARPQLSVSPIPPLVGDADVSDVSNCVPNSSRGRGGSDGKDLGNSIRGGSASDENGGFSDDRFGRRILHRDDRFGDEKFRHDGLERGGGDDDRWCGSNGLGQPSFGHSQSLVSTD
jgi:hypothetical protein